MFEDFFKNYDPTYNPVFHGSWTDWEECGWIFIFEKDGNYFSIEGGYCVMSHYHCDSVWEEDLVPVSEEEALDLMIQWEADEEETWV